MTIEVMRSVVVKAIRKCLLFVELAAIDKDWCNNFAILVSFYKDAPKK